MTDREVTIVEVGPRDGLQNEPQVLPVETRIRLIERLAAAGLRDIEVGAFVSPRWVPQMANAAQVMAGIKRRPGTVYSVLTPNMRGFEAALLAGADEVAIFASASETFSQKNINCSIAESLERFKPLAEAAHEAGMPLRGYVSCVVECPYEGPIAPAAVSKVTADLLALGCHEVSLGDTLGQGRPETISAMLDAVLDIAAADQLAGHYHDTNGRAAESIEVSLDRGLRVFDSAIGGLGGCPYAPGAKGNVDTLVVQALMERLGYETGLNTAHLAEAAALAKSLVAAKPSR